METVIKIVCMIAWKCCLERLCDEACSACCHCCCPGLKKKYDKACAALDRCCCPCCYNDRQKEEGGDDASREEVATTNPVRNMANASAAAQNHVIVASSQQAPEPASGYAKQPHHPMQQSVHQTHQQPATSLTAPWRSQDGFDHSSRIASFR
jgi:hypothetical protein